MMETKEDILKEELKKFRKLSGVIGSGIMRRDGLMIMSDFPGVVNSRGVAAMAAAIVGTSETASKELKIGDMQEVLIQSSKGNLISIGAGSESIFVALTKKNASLESVLGEMKKISKRISKIII